MPLNPIASPVTYLLVTGMCALAMVGMDRIHHLSRKADIMSTSDLQHFADVVTTEAITIPLDVVTEDDDFGARDPHFFEAAAALGLAAEDVQIITEADIDLFSEVDDWTEAYSLDADDYHAFLADIYSDDRFDDIDA